MVEGGPPYKRWWKEVPLLSSSEGAFFFGVITILLQGVINVLVYEAPQELVVNNILKAMIYILCLYNN